MQMRKFWIGASLGIGLLQAWDSGAWSSGTGPLWLTAAGIALPTASLAVRVPHGLRLAALILGALLLVVARVVAPAPLNTLHLALFPAALCILFMDRFAAGRQPHGA
jgi:hypothetical protein